jgi:hypothetical protein
MATDGPEARPDCSLSVSSNVASPSVRATKPPRLAASKTAYRENHRYVRAVEQSGDPPFIGKIAPIKLPWIGLFFGVCDHF